MKSFRIYYILLLTLNCIIERNNLWLKLLYIFSKINIYCNFNKSITVIKLRLFAVYKNNSDYSLSDAFEILNKQIYIF